MVRFHFATLNTDDYYHLILFMKNNTEYIDTDEINSVEKFGDMIVLSSFELKNED